MKDGTKKLPVGWIYAKVEELGEFLRGVSYSKDDASNSANKGYKPILRANNINGDLNFNDLVYVREELIKQEQFIRAGDIIFAMSSGSKHLVGKSAQAKADFDGGFGAFCGAYRPHDNFNKTYLSFFFQSPTYKVFIREIAKGTNINNLKREHILKLNFPLPPLAEQHHIVAKIEELFSDLDAGIASLKQAQAQLKTYRQAVLKYAFEGKLTAAWREQNKPEPAEKLLAQIKVGATRRVAPTKRHGKSKKPKEFPPLTEAELAELPELPEGWCWVPIANLAEVLSGYAFKSSDFIEKGIPAIKISNVGYGEFLWKDQGFLPEEFLLKYEEFSVNPNDLLIALTRPITNNTTKVCLFPEGQKPALLNQRVAAIKNRYAIELHYVFYFFQSTYFKNCIRSEFTETLQPNLSPNDLKRLPIPTCSVKEQHQIVQEIESRLSVCDKLEESIKESLQKAEALRQSILKKAFEGKLGPVKKQSIQFWMCLISGLDCVIPFSVKFMRQ
ncbi:restriction endonuclease subunit S [candidate division KSB1 bacterium]|nr:restriction endonuclease subunit S [candidate division KSB1 bacterium]